MAKGTPWTRVTNDQYRNYANLRKVIADNGFEVPEDKQLEQMLLYMITFEGTYPEDVAKMPVEKAKEYIESHLNVGLNINFG